MAKLIKTNTPEKNFHSGSTRIKDYWQCPECKTEFPEMAVYNWQDGKWWWQIMCNGVQISECPFCTGGSETVELTEDLATALGYDKDAIGYPVEIPASPKLVKLPHDKPDSHLESAYEDRFYSEE